MDEIAAAFARTLIIVGTIAFIAISATWAIDVIVGWWRR